jgi:hypothetical protein
MDSHCKGLGLNTIYYPMSKLNNFSKIFQNLPWLTNVNISSVSSFGYFFISKYNILSLSLKGNSALWDLKKIIAAKSVSHTYHYREAACRLWQTQASPHRSGLQPCRAPASPLFLHHRSLNTTETKDAITDIFSTKTRHPSPLDPQHTHTEFWNSFSMEAVVLWWFWGQIILGLHIGSIFFQHVTFFSLIISFLIWKNWDNDACLRGLLQ